MDDFQCNFFVGSPGGPTVEACHVCPPGHYCDRRGSSVPSGQCAEGHYCPGGQINERPQQHQCSEGHFCEKVSHASLVFSLTTNIDFSFLVFWPNYKLVLVPI